MLSQLKFDLQSSSSSQDNDRNRIMGLSEEVGCYVKNRILTIISVLEICFVKYFL